MCVSVAMCGQGQRNAHARLLPAVEIAGMHYKVVEPGHLKKIAASRVEGLQHHQRPNARLERAVERVRARCIAL